jgi:hypothetical protein
MAVDLAGLRRQSLWLSRLTAVLFGATAALIGFTLAVSALGPAATPDLLPRLLVRWSPTFFYLYALWAIRGTFRSFGRGGELGAAVARGCIRAGFALAAGATLSAVGVPNLIRILDTLGLVARRPGEWAGFLHFDVAYLAVGVVGLAMVLLGRLLGWAGELQREAAALRDELGEFL